MVKETFCIPEGPTNKFNFQRDVLTLCVTNAVTWGIPTAKITDAGVKRTAYEKAYVTASNPGSQNPGTTAAREEAWLPVELVLIDFFNHYLLNNTLIPLATKLLLHINISEATGGIPAPAPSTRPIVQLITEEASMLRLIYADSSTPNKHSKPENVAFCEFCYKIGGTAPVSEAECHERSFISRSHEGISFSTEVRGKTIYGYPRWVNKNGKTGAWGNMVSAIIP